MSVRFRRVFVTTVADRSREVATADHSIERVTDVFVRCRRPGDSHVAGIKKRQNVIRCVVQSPVDITALLYTGINDSVVEFYVY